MSNPELQLATLEQITDELFRRYPHGIAVIGIGLLGNVEVQTRGPHLFGILGAIECVSTSMKSGVAHDLNRNIGKDRSGS